MKKKYSLILLIILIFINISNISAMDNNTDELKIIDNTIEDIDENTLNPYDNKECVSSQNTINQTDTNILKQNKNNETLSNFEPYYTQSTLTIKNTTHFDSTGNITVNMHFSFQTPESDGEFQTYNINIYENNTLTKQININDLNLPEVTPKVTYAADVLFNYTVHEDTFLTTSIFGIYSNTLYFKKIENTILNNNTYIIIDNNTNSNESWNNSINSLKKALKQVKNNGTINLNNIQFIQDTTETLQITKNITIIGNNASFKLEKTQTLLEINQNTQVILINLTFTGDNNYIISNKGKLYLINCTFKENTNGLIDNNAELEIINCNIENINQFYQTSLNEKGLIINNGNLKITHTLFNNNMLLPYSLAFNNNNLNGIIYNTAELTLNDVNFTNINNRIIYNTGQVNGKNIIFKNILTTSTQSLQLINNQNINQKYSYDNYKIQSKSITVNGGVIYNNNKVILENCLFNTITGSIGGAIYNNNKLSILNSTFQDITGIDSAIYNLKESIITNSIFQKVVISGTADNRFEGGTIYNKGTLTLNNILINESTKTGVYNEGILTVDNSTINKCIEDKKYYDNGCGIHNKNQAIITNTIISECIGVGAAIYNEGDIKINNCNIINNQGKVYYQYKSVDQPNGFPFLYIVGINAGVIYNSESGKALIERTIIQNNTIAWGTNQNWNFCYGTTKNDGKMEIYSCIFENNDRTNEHQWDAFGGEGSINIYNTGTLTAMYNYLLNTIYHDPTFNSNIGTNGAKLVTYSFLYNTGKATINYNYYCLPADKIIKNADPNYYFTAGFEKEYYPIKLNENINITLTLALTNGQDTIPFTEWDKLPGQLAFNTTITTINENGEWININTTLYDNITINFNYTGIKKEYNITATVLDYSKHTVLVDVGKEFANLSVEYSNITYNDGEINFKINVTGDYGTPTGNITLTFNNQKNIIPLINGTCNYTLPSTLKPGNYSVKISYDGDNNYFKLLNNVYHYTIYKIKTNIVASSPEVKIGESGLLTVKIEPNSAKLIGIIYIDGEKKYFINGLPVTEKTLKNFAAGSHNITIVFNDDEYYMGGSVTTWFNVTLYETNLTLTSRDIPEGESVAVLNLTINPGDVRGDAILSINGVNSTIYINNTVTPITITDLRDGYYTVSVFYPGDRKYAPSNATTTFSVSRKHTDLSVTITSNDDLTGNIVVNTTIDCTGEVGVYINNDDVLIKNLSDGSASFNVKFKRGTNYIYILYLGDSYYSYVSWNTTTHIEGKAVFNTTNNILDEQKLDYYFIRLLDTDGNPYEYTNISVLFKNETVNLTTDENGTCKLPIKSRAGTYNITLSYKNNTFTDIILVNPSNILINIKDILAGESEVITTTLPDGATGGITLIVDDTYTNKSNTLTVPNLGAGEHNLTVIYTGDDNYTNQTITMKFNVKSLTSQITITSSDITYGDSLTVKGTLTQGATGSVTFTVNNQKQIINITGNSVVAVFKNIPAGEYVLTAHYNGDRLYQGSTDTLSIKVVKANPSLSINTSPLVLNSNIRIDAVLNSDATGNVTFHILGQYSPRNRTITDGVSSWLISPLNTGSYQLVVTYNGDNNYNPVNLTKILVLNQTGTVLKVSIPDISVDDDLMVYATLTDNNGNKISGDVAVEINGKYYRIIINEGTGSRNLGEFKANTYTYTATYTGSDKLAMSTSSGSVSVKNNNYIITGGKNIVMYYGAGKNYKVRVLNNNLAIKNVVVKITINKKSVNVKTDNQGYATLKLNLKAGKYTITTMYKSVKVSSKITVKPTLITKNKVIKKGKTLKFTAKLLNKNGKVLKNKKITFKVKGKKYTAKTNKKGVATVKVKNLKVGKFKIQSIYGKIKNTNTIKVKK